MKSSRPGEVSTAPLPFDEKAPFTQQRAYAGDVLYTEGMPSHHMYVVKEGIVDIYMVREEKRVVVETLGKGQCFGMSLHDLRGKRINNAAARTYCELYLVSNDTLEQDLAGAPDLTRSLLHALSDRLAMAHELIATRVNYQSDILIYAQLLQLMGNADLARQGVPARAKPGSAEALAAPLLADVFINARTLFGHSDKHVRACLGKLLGLHLLRVEDESGSGKRLIFSPKDIVAQARKVAQTQVEHSKLEYEYVSVDEFAALVDVDRSLLLRKVAGSEFSDDVFTFRKSEIMRLLNEKGKKFFVERKIKRPDEFTDIADLEFADQKSVFATVAQFDTLDLAKVLSTVDEDSVKQKILSALSRSKREEVEADLQGLTNVDPMDVQRISQSMIASVQKLMMRQPG